MKKCKFCKRKFYSDVAHKNHMCPIVVFEEWYDRLPIDEYQDEAVRWSPEDKMWKRRK
jgi:hypothetical protein